LLGLNVIEGEVVYPGVGEAFGIDVADAEAVIARS
jgi:alanine dehydrogenase